MQSLGFKSAKWVLTEELPSQTSDHAVQNPTVFVRRYICWWVVIAQSYCALHIWSGAAKVVANLQFGA